MTTPKLSAPSKAPVLAECRDIHFAWSRDRPFALALDHLAINTGERLFVMGPSGSGKSTLLSLLTGIVIPQQGRVDILGKSLNRMTAAQRDHFRADHLGYIFQQFNLVPYLSVLENVTLPCHFSARRAERARRDAGSPEAEAKRLLEHLGLVEHDGLRQPVRELSVGQQQRVAAARALIGFPELIIADEPTSALDSDTRSTFINLLFQECEREQSTLVFVSHDHALAGMFDRTVKLQAGHMLATSDLETEKGTA